jgi:hypothetical protein
VTQATYGSEFENVNDATRDFRLKSGASQINTGTTDATNAPTDIVGTARPQGGSYDVGVWEFAISSGASRLLLLGVGGVILAGGAFARRRCFVCFIFVSGCIIALYGSACMAEDLYVGQSDAGAANGTSCANQHSAAWFNTAANWGGGAGEIDPGDTAHLCGTITTALMTRTDGAVGNPITLKWEADAKISMPYCPFTDPIYGCLKVWSYFVVDGGSNGIIEATANGSPSSFANQQNGHGIILVGTDVEIKNLTIQNIYVQNDFADPSFIDANAIFLNQASVASNISIHDNTIHDNVWSIVFTPTANTSTWNIYNNNIYNTDHAIALAGYLNITNSNINIYGNHIHDFANWDMAGCGAHHDGIHAYGAPVGGTTYENLSIYNNLFDGNLGDCLTAYIFEESTTHVPGELIFNNVFTLTNQPVGGTGLIAVGPSSGDIALYNNTFQCAALNSGPQAIYLNVLSTYKAKNNLVINCGTLVNVGASFAASGLDYNVYATSTGSLLWRQGASYYTTFANWRSATGQDANAQYTSGSAGLDGSYKPQAGSIAIDAGTNLSGLGITALNSDKDGLSRPQGSAWDAGAYEFDQGGAGSPPPDPPQPPPGAYGGFAADARPAAGMRPAAGVRTPRP